MIIRQNDPATRQIDEATLYHLGGSEASKAYFTKKVDEDNAADLFREYRRLAASMIAVVRNLNPAYVYPHALVSTLLEPARKQLFFPPAPALAHQCHQPGDPAE